MKKTAIIAAHALVGWALCGATMALALAFTFESTALVLHAIAAPIFFSIISFVYFTKFHFTGPLKTAVMFVGVVVLMDVVVVAMLIERSFDMFRSLTGTWLVFALIFVSTWLTGVLVNRASIPSAMPASITTELIWAEIEAQLFAVLSYVTPKAEARSAGIVYIVRDRKLYIATGADSWKAKHIRLNPRVALNVTIPKRIPFMPWIKIPAATIALHGMARVIAAKDADAGVIQALMRGKVEDLELVAQTCVIEVEPTGHFVTYGVGVPLLAMRDPKKARARVPVA